MKTTTATQAKIQFGHLLDSAARGPIIITKSNRNIAVIISFEEYSKMSAIEDQYWANKAKKAKQEGLIGTKASEKLMEELLDAAD
jgi:prevent-host-death family protein